MLWATAYELLGGDSPTFPSPWAVLNDLVSGLREDYLGALGASLLRLSYGFGLAMVMGSALGVALALSRTAEWLLGPLVLGVQCLPSICWLPVAILTFGLSEKAILFVVLMGSVGSITMAVRDGLKQVPTTWLRVADTFGAGRLQRLFQVQIPSAVPGFITGLKQGWSFAWRSLLAGEMLYRIVGVGGLLTEARDLAEYPKMFAVMLLIVGISVLVDQILFGVLERRVRARWGIAA